MDHGGFALLVKAKQLKFLLFLLFILLLPVASAEQVQVGDISIRYNIEGQGDPILLINGFGNALDSWRPALIEKLKENHTVITFDNRGVGNTTSGDKKFTIQQFAKDTDLFLSRINVNKTDVLGTSMGGMIAQELALFSNKIDKLIIASSHCGQDITPPSKEVQKLENLKPSELKEKLPEVIYPEEFNFSTLPKSSEIVTDKTIAAQQKAILDWKGTCDKLKNIKQETLVIVGKHDNFTPPPNSVLIAKNIKGSTLIQVEGGHPITAMYPDKFANIILLFLNNESEKQSEY